MLDKDRLLTAFPKQSAVFDDAVDAALRQVHNQAELERQMARKLRIRRAMGWALAGAMLLAGAFGIAEGARRGVFDFLWRRDTALESAAELSQKDICEMRAGSTTLRVTEAVYDGAAVRLVMSLQNDGIRRPLAEGEQYGDGEFGAALAADGITAQYSFDWFTIDGAEYGMTGGSGGENAIGENDGEALIYFELLLAEGSGEDIPAPTKDFTLGLPVRTAETREARQLLIPVKVVAENLLRDVTPEAPVTFGADGGEYTVTVLQARLSPIANVVELRADAPDAMSDDAAWEAISAWEDIALVDESGAATGAADRMYWGMPAGETDDLRHFIIRIEVEPQTSYPSRLFVAPISDDGEADMSLAVELDLEGR